MHQSNQQQLNTTAMSHLKIIPNIVVMSTLLFFTMACTGNQNESSSTGESTELVSEVMTKEKQDALTPEKVLEDFKEGNERYMNNNLTPWNYVEQAKKTASGQYPEAVVLSCLDSRVPVEHIFDKGIGDIFVGRVAGNFVNVDMLGSLEFATQVAGSKLVVIMGHESCGAVKSAIDDVQLGNITAMLEKIKPAVAMTGNYEGEQTTQNSEYVTRVVENNVRYTIGEIREKSPIIRQLEEEGDILIMGAFYDLDTGKVTFLDS